MRSLVSGIRNDWPSGTHARDRTFFSSLAERINQTLVGNPFCALMCTARVHWTKRGLGGRDEQDCRTKEVAGRLAEAGRRDALLPLSPMSPASDDGFRFGVKNQKRGEESAVRRGRLRKNMVQRRQQQQHRTRPAQQMSDGFSRLKEQRINEWEAMSGKEDSEQRKNMIKQSNDLFLAALLSPTAIKTRLRFA